MSIIKYSLYLQKLIIIYQLKYVCFAFFVVLLYVDAFTILLLLFFFIYYNFILILGSLFVSCNFSDLEDLKCEVSTKNRESEAEFQDYVGLRNLRTGIIGTMHALLRIARSYDYVIN